MVDAEAGSAVLNSTQAMSEGNGGYNAVGDGSGEQIDSSDEYDPAQDVQDFSFPAPQNQASSVESSNNASRPSSAIPQQLSTQGLESHAVSDATHRQHLHQDSMKLPTMVDTIINGANSTALPVPSATGILKARLPHDTLGILEDRIKEDEKGDLDTWLNLIAEYKRRNKLDDVRKIYDRFFTIFPQAAEQWVALAQLENEAGNRAGVESIFNKTLKDLPNLQLWCTYLDHVRRYFNIAVDKSGEASQTNHAAYEAVLDAVGIDKDSGTLWQDYIMFIKSGPGVLGQQDWQGQQKMDLLRKAYQRAVCIPTPVVDVIWKDYTSFEMSLNKITGRKFIQEKSPDYLTAKSAFTVLQRITRDLKRTTLSVLPPALGFDGDIEYMKQVEIWKNWIQWEKDDPLVLKDDNVAAYRNRVIYTYKQALMALRFWPEMWYDAADFCFSNDLESEGNEFLSQGILANPESCLLAFKRADRLELSTTNGNDDNSKQQRGIKVREPYNKLLDALYSLINKAMEREKRDIARIEAEYPDQAIQTDTNDKDEDDEEEDSNGLQNGYSKLKQKQVNAVKDVSSVQISLLNRTISHAWVALMRAMQRMQGKGKVNAQIGGSRQIFTDARKRGRITSEVWVAAAMLEFHNTDSEAAKRIFERGMKLFPEDETFSLEYIKLLTNANDHTNARAVFETSISRLSSKPETMRKAKPLYTFFHRYESHYGELAQVVKLEARMKEAFPDDFKLSAFSQRFVSDGFDPAAIRHLISPISQARPKLIASIEAPPSRQPSPPAVRLQQVTNSPKRPLPLDDLDMDPNRPRKLARGESPALAGAAGRRLNQLNQMKQNRQPYDNAPSGQSFGYLAPPPPLPREVIYLLSVIPPASTYNATHFKVDEVIRLLRETNIPATVGQLPARVSTATGGPQYSQSATNYQVHSSFR